MNDNKMMSGELCVIWGLGIVFFLCMFGMFMVLLVLIMYGMVLQGVSEVLIGLVIGIYGLVQVVFQIFFGLLFDCIGCKLLIVGGLFIFVFGSVIVVFIDFIWGIIFGCVLQGFGVIVVVVMVLFFDFICEQNCIKVMVFIGVSFGVIFVIVMVLGLIVIYQLGLYVLFWMIVILVIVGILFILWVVFNSYNYVFNCEFGMVKGCFSKVLVELCLLKFNFGIMCLYIMLMFIFVVLFG